MNRKFLLVIAILTLGSQSEAQNQHDKGVFVKYQSGYYQNYILKGIEDFDNQDEEVITERYFAVDKSGMKLPNDTSLYTKCWHNNTVSQGATGTCWCFGGIAMIESEIFREAGKKVKLSEMYIVYWEYVERAKSFVNSRGETYFAEGSEANAVPRIMKKYGCVPASAYSGMLPGQTIHDHRDMIAEMLACLGEIKRISAWNEDAVVLKIRTILDAYLGSPPTEFMYNGKFYSPASFLNEEVEIKPDDYFSFMSTMEMPYYQKGELIEADNWWHNDDYYNVPINDFIKLLTSSLENSYTVCICGDVSEPGYDRFTQTGIIPSFDIPSEYIDETARQMRLNNQTTTDDHCMLAVGYCVAEGKKWFLLKDSGAGAFDGNNVGYRFVSEDYVKLKMMNIMLYKYAARDILDKIIK